MALFQPWLEQSMTRHMGIELPLLFILGWFAARTAGAGLIRALAPWNMAGVPGLAFSILVMSVWMVPSALDYAVISPAVAVLKVLSLVAAGMLTRISWKVAGIVIQAFFVMNWFWMTFVVGVLYRDAPQQLCSVYLADEQAHTGLAMMAWSVFGILLWAASVSRKLRQWNDQEVLSGKSSVS